MWTTVDEIYFVTKLAGFEYTEHFTNEAISPMNAVPIVRAQNVKMGRFIENRNEAITIELSEQLSRSALYKDCLLMTFIGAGVGETCIFHANKRNHLAPNVAKIEPFDENINMEYALFFFMSSLGQQGVTNISKSTAQASLSMATIRELVIPIPPIKEQSRIAKEVVRWFSVIECIEENTGNLQETIKQTKSKILDLAIHGKLVPQDPNDEPAIELLKRINPKAEIISDNGHYQKLPEGWCLTILGSIGTWQSGATPSRLQKDYYGGNIPWLKTGDLNDGIITNIPEFITEKALKETSVKLNPIDSILIAMYGATIGKIGILSFPATTNQACCACLDYKIDKMYIFYFLLSNRINFVSMGGGGAQPNISKEKIVNTTFPLPPLAEQKRIVSKIEELFHQLDMIEESL